MIFFQEELKKIKLLYNHYTSLILFTFSIVTILEYFSGRDIHIFIHKIKADDKSGRKSCLFGAFGLLILSIIFIFLRATKAGPGI